VTHEDFEALVRSHGLESWPIKGKVQDIAQSQAMRERLGRGSFLAVMKQMAKEAERGAVALAKGALAACGGVDLVVGGIGGLFIGSVLADKLSLPFLQAYYIPFTPTQAYPSFLFHRFPTWLGRSLNRLSYRVTRQIIWQGFRSADKRARKDVLDMKPAPFWGPFHADCLQHAPVLYGFSPAVIPKACDWDDRTYVTGYWFLDPTSDWTPPPALASFLEAGPPPVYVGFGSMSSRRPDETADLVLQALARAGKRGVLLSGWGGLQTSGVPDTVHVLDSAPFSWLFPRMAAVVHHGGAGTTAAGFRAGVPSIVVPFFGDQFFWGRRVAELGVGNEPMARKGLTAERLAQGIQTALTDQRMRQRAAELGAPIRDEDGVARAVAIVEQMAQHATA
jgi:UDP:flavonoid glycosyltransferase YjiC (YdhE family)